MRSVVVGGLNFELFSKRLETVPFPNLNSVLILVFTQSQCVCVIFFLIFVRNTEDSGIITKVNEMSGPSQLLWKGP